MRLSLLYLFTSLSASQEVGEVPVTVTTESGKVIGYTMFIYKDDVNEMVKQIVEDRTLQSEFFAKLSKELAKENLASDLQKTEALGPVHVPHVGKSKIKFSPVSGIFAPYWYLISQVFNFASYAKLRNWRPANRMKILTKLKHAKFNTRLENSNHIKKMTNI